MGKFDGVLIASDYDSEAVQKRLGLSLVTIPMEELLAEIRDLLKTK